MSIKADIQLRGTQALREKGQLLCQTTGSNHYKAGGLQPIDILTAKGMSEDFFIGNIVKYAIRFKETRNLADIKKVVDYGHMLAGLVFGVEVGPAPPPKE